MLEGIALIVLVNLVTYFRTLRYGLVSDDMGCRQTSVPSKDESIKYKLLDCWRRIYGDLFLKTNEREHLVVTLFHALNCCLIFWVFGANKVSLIAALLYSLNPANNHVSIWLSGRVYARFITLILLSWKFAFTFPLFYFLSTLAVYAMFPAPIVYLCTTNWHYIFLMPLWFFVRKKMDKEFREHRKKAMTPVMEEMSLRKLIFSVKVYAYYFWHFLSPRRLGMYHTFTYEYGVTKQSVEEGNCANERFMFGLLTLVGVALGIIYNPLNIRLGLVWWSAYICMWLHFPKTYYQASSSRYGVYANIGLMLVLANVLSVFPLYVTLIVLTYYFARLQLHMGAYKDNFTYLEYNLYDINFPDSLGAYTLHGTYLDMRGRKLEALITWAKGWNRYKTDSRINILLAKQLLLFNKLGEAYHHICAAECNPYDGKETGLNNQMPLLKKEIWKRIMISKGYVEVKEEKKDVVNPK